MRLLDALSKAEATEAFGTDPDDKRLGLPSSLVPSDHLPVAAAFRSRPPAVSRGGATVAAAKASAITEAAAAAEPASAVPQARAEELEAQWRALEARAPPKVRGRPSDKEIVALQANTTEARRFAAELCDDAENPSLPSCRGPKIKRHRKRSPERHNTATPFVFGHPAYLPTPHSGGLDLDRVERCLGK